MNLFKSSAELKASAREHMFGHYGTAIGAYFAVMWLPVCLMSMLFFLTDTTTILGTIIYYVLSFVICVFMGLLVSGNCFLYLKISCGRPVTVGDIFYGFRLCPDKALMIQLWITLISYIANLPMALRLCTRVREVAAENAIFAFVIKAILIFLSLTGYCNIWFAIFIDMVAALATILNSIRVTSPSLIGILKYKAGK